VDVLKPLLPPEFWLRMSQNEAKADLESIWYSGVGEFKVDKDTMLHSQISIVEGRPNNLRCIELLA
jgi:hypothetical protein